MATELEARWMESMASLTPRYIESERVWCVAYDNEFNREIERFGSRGEAMAFVRGLMVSSENTQ